MALHSLADVYRRNSPKIVEAKPPQAKAATPSPQRKATAYDEGMARAGHHGIPAVRTKAEHTPAASEEVVTLYGTPVVKRKLDRFNETMCAIAQNNGIMPHSPQWRAVVHMADRAVEMHLEHFREHNDSMQAAADRLATQRAAAASRAEQWDHFHKTRADWRDHFKEDPDHEAKLARAKAAVDQYGREKGESAAQELRDLMSHTGAGDHRAVIHFAEWAGRGAGGGRGAAVAARPGAKSKGRSLSSVYQRVATAAARLMAPVRKLVEA